MMIIPSLKVNYMKLAMKIVKMTITNTMMN